jgi:hypothetical protein
MMDVMQLLLALLLAANIAPDSGKPEYRQPQLATDSRMVAATFGAGTAIYFAASYDRGRTFSKPLKVAEAPLLSLGRHRGPRIAITPSAIVISAVVATKTPPGTDGDLKAWRSVDGGKTWSAGVMVNDEPSAAREGLHAMAAGPDGRLFATWLDLRKKGTRLYGATSTDGGATWSKNAVVYESPSGTICQCCHPSAAIDANGGIHVMWRNAVEGNRDMYTAVSTDGGSTFGKAEKLGEGSWKLDACPMDGGGLALNSQGKAVSVWRRGGDIFVTASGEKERKIDAGKDAALTIASSGVYVVWTNNGAVRALVPGKTEPILLAPQGAFPQLIAVPGGPVVAAWEDHGQIAWKQL